MSVASVMTPLRRAAALLLVVLVASCAPRLVAPYDAHVVEEMNAFNADVRTFIAAMQREAGTEGGTYGRNVAFYEHWLGRLGALADYAHAIDPDGTCPGAETFGGLLSGGVEALVGRVGLAAEPPPAPPGGGCTARLVWLLNAQVQDLAAFHKAQGPIGIDPRASAPGETIAQAVRAVVYVESRKKGMEP